MRRITAASAAAALGALILIAPADTASAQSPELHGLFSGGIGLLPPLPRGAVAPPDSEELTRDDILGHFANCADSVITDLFGDMLTGMVRGVGSRSLTRAYFWGCAFRNGWPPPTYDGGFIGSPVAIVESVMAGADADMTGTAALVAACDTCTLEQVAEGLRTNNCWTYYYLWLALTDAMTATAVAQLTAPDARGICGA